MSSMIPTNGVCTSCGAENVVLLPVEPLFRREEVCCLVPIKYTTLRSYLSKHRHLFGPPRYMGPKGKSFRMFTGEEVKTLRRLRLRSTR